MNGRSLYALGTGRGESERRRKKDGAHALTAEDASMARVPRWFAILAALVPHRTPLAARAIASRDRGTSRGTVGVGSAVVETEPPPSNSKTPMSASLLRHVDEDATAESVRERLAASPLALVVAVASHAPRSRALLKDVAALLEEEDCDGGRPAAPDDVLRPDVYVIRTDASDALEDLAIDLGMRDVPGYRIYRRGRPAGASASASAGGPSGATVDAIRDGLRKAAAAASGSGCCPPGSESDAGACCPPGPGGSGGAAAACCPPGGPEGSDAAAEGAPADPAEHLRLVQRSYAATANGGGFVGAASPEALGYTQVNGRRGGRGRTVRSKESFFESETEFAARPRRRPSARLSPRPDSMRRHGSLESARFRSEPGVANSMFSWEHGWPWIDRRGHLGGEPGFRVH